MPWDVIEKKIFKIIKLTKKPIFVEKPIALSSKKLSQICKISDKFNKKVFVLYNRRYFQSVEFLKNKLKNKKPLFKIFIPDRVSASGIFGVRIQSTLLINSFNADIA